MHNYIQNEFDDGFVANFEADDNTEISVLFPLNLSVDKIRGNVDTLQKNGLTNIILLKSGSIRTLVLLNLTAEERQMIDAGIIIKTRKVC